MNSNTELQKRPTFLKVLCILSFVSCGVWILYDLISVAFWLIDSFNNNQQNFSNTTNQNLSFLVYQGPESLINILVQLVCLVGVLLIWKFRKQGFYIYLAAESYLYIQFAYLIWESNLDFIAAKQVGLEMIWPLPFDIAFFIMYATQLKYMTKNSKSIRADL